MKLLFKTFSKDLKNIRHVIFPAHTDPTAVGVPSGYEEALIGKPEQPALIRQNCITQKKVRTNRTFLYGASEENRTPVFSLEG